LKKETVNDVVFIMANAKLSKKKLFQRPLQELNLRDVSSDNEWIVEENGTPNSVEDDVNVIEYDIDGVPPQEKIGKHINNLDGEGSGEVGDYYQFED
jgi:hypothetical protein